jgi:hypothetical protein
MDDNIYEDHALIVPPVLNSKDIPLRKVKYIIDSRDRNIDLYPNPAKYTIKVEESITDVTNVELILTDFKFNNYNIKSTNNILHTSQGDYFIPEGIYDGESIASTLTSETPLTVTYNPLNKKLTFVCGSDITLNFKSTEKKQYDCENQVNVYTKYSIGKFLGFPISNYDLVASTPFLVPYPLDLETENYIVMFMQQAKVYQSKKNSTHNCFAIINKSDSYSNGIVMFDNNVSKSFNPPIANLTNLVFKFCDYEGNLYDFQNKEHRFEVVFTCLKQTRCYNQIFK